MFIEVNAVVVPKAAEEPTPATGAVVLAWAVPTVEAEASPKGATVAVRAGEPTAPGPAAIPSTDRAAFTWAVPTVPAAATPDTAIVAFAFAVPTASDEPTPVG
jgi:hypothetical protein